MINKIQLKNNMSNSRILEDADFKTIIDGTLDTPDNVIIDISENDDKSGIKVKKDNGDFYNVPIKRSTANSLDHTKVLGSFEQSNDDEDSDYDNYNFMDYDGNSTNSYLRVPRTSDNTDKIEPGSVASSFKKVDGNEKTTYTLNSYSGTKIQTIETPKSGFFSSLDVNKILGSYKTSANNEDSNYNILTLQDYNGNDKYTIKTVNKGGSGAILKGFFSTENPRGNNANNKFISQNFSFSYGSDYHSTPGILPQNGDFLGSKLFSSSKSEGTNALLKYLQHDSSIGFSSVSNDKYIKDNFKNTTMTYGKYSVSTSIRLNNQNLNNESMKDFDLQLIKNSKTDSDDNKYNTIPLGKNDFKFNLPFIMYTNIFTSSDNNLTESNVFFGHALYNSEVDSDHMFVYAIDIKIDFGLNSTSGTATVNVKKLSDIDAPDLQIEENLMFHMVRSSVKK